MNIFAFDFSGTGKSGGEEKHFSRRSIVRDFEAVTAYIKDKYSSNIHLYGSSGIGGMFAQYCACAAGGIKSFAQFACVDYGNTAGMGYPLPAAKLLSLMFKRLPNLHLTVRPPKYTGFNADADNAFYTELEQRHPNIWRTSTKILNTMLECFVAPDSAVKKGVGVPTLVYKTLHDRYFKPQYFDRYIESLTCQKKLVEIDNVHNSYFLCSDLFCQAAYNWFRENP